MKKILSLGLVMIMTISIASTVISPAVSLEAKTHSSSRSHSSSKKSSSAASKNNSSANKAKTQADTNNSKSSTTNNGTSKKSSRGGMFGSFLGGMLLGGLLFGGMPMVGSIFNILFIVVIIMVIVKLFTGKKKKKNNDTTQQASAQQAPAQAEYKDLSERDQLFARLDDLVAESNELDMDISYVLDNPDMSLQKKIAMVESMIAKKKQLDNE